MQNNTPSGLKTMYIHVHVWAGGPHRNEPQKLENIEIRFGHEFNMYQINNLS